MSTNPSPIFIGVLHLPALPGAPRYKGSWCQVRERLMADASALVENGIRHLLLENFGDVPFFPGAVPQHVVAHMTALAADLKSRLEITLGINVLRNDGCAALSVAHAVGADFIRVNVLCGARVTDQGIVQGVAHDLLRLRRALAADRIRILADVDVKHSAPWAKVPLEQEVVDLVHRGGADGLIVTGSGTGHEADLEQLRAVRRAAGQTPVYVGSGIRADNVNRFIHEADGLIVGSALKHDGVAGNPVDPARVRALVQACQDSQS